MIAWGLDYWNQWALVASFCTFLFCFSWVLPRFGLAASLLFACCAYSAIWTWLFVNNRYVTVDVYNQMALRYFACDSIAKAMLVLVPFMVLSKRRMTMLFFGEFAASAFVLCSSLFCLWEARHGCNGLTCGGLIGNPSISMGFMACLLPVFIHSWRRQWPILILATAAIFVSKSSIAIGLLATYAALWLLLASHSALSGKRLLRGVAMASAAFIAVLGAARIYLGHGELLSDSGRFGVWRFMMDRWSAPGNILTGTGIGTYHVFSINLQNAPGHPPIAPGYWWNTLHNDPLQMLFECGLVGLILLAATYISALVKLVREQDWTIAMSVIMYGLYMCLDPALHNPLPILFGAWLFVYALRKPKEYL